MSPVFEGHFSNETYNECVTIQLIVLKSVAPSQFPFYGQPFSLSIFCLSFCYSWGQRLSIINGMLELMALVQWMIIQVVSDCDLEFRHFCWKKALVYFLSIILIFVQNGHLYLVTAHVQWHYAAHYSLTVKLIADIDGINVSSHYLSLLYAWSNFVYQISCNKSRTVSCSRLKNLKKKLNFFWRSWFLSQQLQKRSNNSNILTVV